MNTLVAEVSRVSSVLLACEHAAEAIATLENYRWAGWIRYILEILETETTNDQQIPLEQHAVVYRQFLYNVRQSVNDVLLAYPTLDDEE